MRLSPTPPAGQSSRRARQQAVSGSKRRVRPQKDSYVTSVIMSNARQQRVLLEKCRQDGQNKLLELNSQWAKQLAAENIAFLEEVEKVKQAPSPVKELVQLSRLPLPSAEFHEKKANLFARFHIKVGDDYRRDRDASLRAQRSFAHEQSATVIQSKLRSNLSKRHVNKLRSRRDAQEEQIKAKVRRELREEYDYRAKKLREELKQRA